MRINFLMSVCSLTVAGLLAGNDRNVQLPQLATLAAPRFDVASIRPSSSSVTSGSFRRLEAGILEISGMTVKELISTAYSLRDYEISGGLKWTASERFDIAAKDTSLAGVDSHHLTGTQWSAAVSLDYAKLGTLLRDRFQLKTHIEKRQLPGYVVVVSKPGKVQQAECAAGYYLSRGLAKGQMKITSVAADLSRDMNMRVVDGTGLEGCYDIDLKWTLDPNNTEVPSVDTALGALGLHLKAKKEPGDVLVIDSVERPSPN